MSFTEEPEQPRAEIPNNAGWATFEARVRARRVAACVERAGGLIDGGQIAEAREAINEARQLAPHAPEIAELEQRIARSSPGAILLATPDTLPVAGGQIDEPRPLAADIPEEIAELEHRIHAQPSPGAILLAAPESLPIPPERIRPSREWPRVVAAVAVVAAVFFAAGYGVVKFRHEFTIPEFLSTEDATPAPVRPAAKETESRRAGRAAETEQPPAPQVAAPPPDPAPEPKQAQPESAPSTLGAGPTQSATASAQPGRRAAPPATPTATIGQDRVMAMPPVTSGSQAPTQSSTPADNTPIPQVRPLGGARPEEAVALEMTSPTPAATTGAQPMATLDAPVPAPPPPGGGESRHDESLRIRAVLLRFENAYNRLDAKAASAVWPGVNEPALNRAFSGLVSQKVSLGLCDITVFGSIAGANCAGKARWEPKVGGGLQTADRYWTFQLTKSADGWNIKEVLVR